MTSVLAVKRESGAFGTTLRSCGQSRCCPRNGKSVRTRPHATGNTFLGRRRVKTDQPGDRPLRPTVMSRGGGSVVAATQCATVPPRHLL